MRRFKTGTPARIYRDSIDFSKMEIQLGDNSDRFSFMSPRSTFVEEPCYLTYTNEKTHKIILDNIDRSPLYNGTILSIGPRYCPSIETKVMRFKDKERHQILSNRKAQTAKRCTCKACPLLFRTTCRSKCIALCQGLKIVALQNTATQ